MHFMKKKFNNKKPQKIDLTLKSGVFYSNSCISIPNLILLSFFYYITRIDRRRLKTLKMSRKVAETQSFRKENIVSSPLMFSSKTVIL